MAGCYEKVIQLRRYYKVIQTFLPYIKCEDIDHVQIKYIHKEIKSVVFGI
jgi:hypothetical protein